MSKVLLLTSTFVAVVLSDTSEVASVYHRHHEQYERPRYARSPLQNENPVGIYGTGDVERYHGDGSWKDYELDKMKRRRKKYHEKMLLDKKAFNGVTKAPKKSSDHSNGPYQRPTTCDDEKCWEDEDSSIPFGRHGSEDCTMMHEDARNPGVAGGRPPHGTPGDDAPCQNEVCYAKYGYGPPEDACPVDGHPHEDHGYCPKCSHRYYTPRHDFYGRPVHRQRHHVHRDYYHPASTNDFAYHRPHMPDDPEGNYAPGFDSGSPGSVNRHRFPSAAEESRMQCCSQGEMSDFDQIRQRRGFVECGQCG